MITVIIKQTKGGSWQGIALDPPDHVPKSIWHGNPHKVKESFLRFTGGEVRFISLSDGWDQVYE